MGIPDMNNKKIKHCIKHNKVKAICSRRGLAAILYIINSIILHYGWPFLSTLPEKGEETKTYTRDNEMYALKR